jgi:hypothetical protein
MRNDWNQPPGKGKGPKLPLDLSNNNHLLDCYKSCPAPLEITAFYSEIAADMAETVRLTISPTP